MFFTLKLLKLFVTVLLLPFRVVAKLLRFLVGFAAGRAQGNASVGGSFGHDGDESRDGPDPIRDPDRENETPVEEGTRRTDSNTTGASVASAAATDDQVLSPTQYAGVLGALAFGQLLGLLAYEADVAAVAGAIVDVRFVAATPLFDAVYWGFLPPGSNWLYGVAGVAYAGFYGWLGWRAYDGGAVPSRLARPAAGVFAANAVAYAVTPLLYVNEVPFTSDYVGYYTSGGTLVQVVVYGALMGLLYVATQRLVGRPPTAAASASDAAGGAEPAPWAQDDGPATDETAATSGDDEDSPVLDESVTADTQEEQSTAEPTADPQPADGTRGASAGAGESATADAPGGEPGTDQSPEAGDEPTADQTPDADGEPATATAGGATAAAQSEAADASDGAAETTDGEDTDPEEGGVAAPTNEAEAALGRLAGDDPDSRLAAAGDLQSLAAEGHDYLTGERLGDAFDDEPDPEVRAALVDALAELETDAATDALRDARFDPNPTVSDRAAEHLD